MAGSADEKAPRDGADGGPGDLVRGAITLADLERERAFSDGDVRLLHARQRDERGAGECPPLRRDQRLLRETEQRAAELAIINSVRQALAAELNMQGIYDAVGDKIREIYGKADLDIRIFDEAVGLVRFPYVYDRRVRIDVSRPSSPNAASPRTSRTRQTLVVNERMAERSCSTARTAARHADGAIGGVRAAVLGRRGTRPAQCERDYEREHAFSDADVRLLETLNREHEAWRCRTHLFDGSSAARAGASPPRWGARISSTLDIAQVMQRIAHHARELLHADNSAIFVPAGRDLYRAIVADGPIEQQLREHRGAHRRGIIGSIIQSGRAEQVNDASRDPRAVQIDDTPDGVDRRLMVAPLGAVDRPLGAIALWRSGGEPFKPHELEFRCSACRWRPAWRS